MESHVHLYMILAVEASAADTALVRSLTRMSSNMRYVPVTTIFGKHFVAFVALILLNHFLIPLRNVRMIGMSCRGGLCLVVLATKMLLDLVEQILHSLRVVEDIATPFRYPVKSSPGRSAEGQGAEDPRGERRPRKSAVEVVGVLMVLVVVAHPRRGSARRRRPGGVQRVRLLEVATRPAHGSASRERQGPGRWVWARRRSRFSRRT